MKLDGAIFAIEQRSVGGCIDLAIVFVREHLLSMLLLLACFAVPSVILTWWLVTYVEWTLFACVLLFAIECPFFGAALVAAAGHRVFGEPFSVMTGLRSLMGRFFSLLVLLAFARMVTGVGALFFLFPSYILATRYGFLAEILLLERCRGLRYESRLSDLLSGLFGHLLGRLVTIFVFFGSCTLSLFMLIDLASSTLLGLPIFTGRISSLEYAVEETLTLLTVDPRVATVLISVMWLVYPVTRLSWMFCYFDVRIRKEGWDIELDFRVEAQRLEASQ